MTEAKSNVEQSPAAKRIEGAEQSIWNHEQGATEKLSAAVQSVSLKDAAATFKQVSNYDAQAHQQSFVELSQNGSLTMTPIDANPHSDSLSSGPPTSGAGHDMYDNIPNHGEPFTGADGNKYYWNSADHGSTDKDFAKMKKQYGDKLQDYKYILDGGQRQMILEWKADK